MPPVGGAACARNPLPVSIDLQRGASILSSMRRFLKRLHESFARLVRRKPRHQGLTAIEYEAVCLITYEGRDAYARAREQAFYCRDRGSEQGFRFWSEVAVEVQRRTGGAWPGRTMAKPE